VGSAGRRWHIVASSYRCQLPAGPLFFRLLNFSPQNIDLAVEIETPPQEAAPEHG
jgi:hypothetical protein